MRECRSPPYFPLLWYPHPHCLTPEQQHTHIPAGLDLYPDSIHNRKGECRYSTSQTQDPARLAQSVERETLIARFISRLWVRPPRRAQFPAHASRHIFCFLCDCSIIPCMFLFCPFVLLVLRVGLVYVLPYYSRIAHTAIDSGKLGIPFALP